MVVNWKVFLGSSNLDNGGVWRRGGSKDFQRARKYIADMLYRTHKHFSFTLVEVYFRAVEPLKPFGQQGYDKPFEKVFSGSLEDFNEWLVNEADKDTEAYYISTQEKSGLGHYLPRTPIIGD